CLFPEKDRDVRPYVQEKEIEWLQVELPAEMAEIRGNLEKIFNDRLATIKDMGFGEFFKASDLVWTEEFEIS
ncbi:MAG: hypothetical protein HGA25_07940, partial [Clostridiales bacterium]|nr:hypothetical protein [Clostridiales bacterium]